MHVDLRCLKSIEQNKNRDLKFVHFILFCIQLQKHKAICVGYLNYQFIWIKVKIMVSICQTNVRYESYQTCYTDFSFKVDDFHWKEIVASYSNWSLAVADLGISEPGWAV